MTRRVSRENAKPAAATTPKGRGPYFYAYRSNSRVDRLEARHQGLRALVESLLRRRVCQAEIARRVRARFGVRLSRYSLSRYFQSRVQPQENAEAAAYRQAHAQARALLEEMKADPSLDAAQIAELMLAHQIVRDRMKLADADILDLYREHASAKSSSSRAARCACAKNRPRWSWKSWKRPGMPRRRVAKLLKRLRKSMGSRTRRSPLPRLESFYAFSWYRTAAATYVILCCI